MHTLMMMLGLLGMFGTSIAAWIIGARLLNAISCSPDAARFANYSVWTPERIAEVLSEYRRLVPHAPLIRHALWTLGVAFVSFVVLLLTAFNVL
jgi:hypothetical protein